MKDTSSAQIHCLISMKLHPQFYLPVHCVHTNSHIVYYTTHTVKIKSMDNK